MTAVLAAIGQQHELTIRATAAQGVARSEGDESLVDPKKCAHACIKNDTFRRTTFIHLTLNAICFGAHNTLVFRQTQELGIVRLAGEDVIGGFPLHPSRMRTSVSLYHRQRFPAEIISHSVWRYFRFALSFRDIEMLAMRGVTLDMSLLETVSRIDSEFGGHASVQELRCSDSPGPSITA